MYQITLEDDTAKLLVDVIDMHVEGVAAAKELTEVDPTVASAEQLLELMSGYDDDMRALLKLRTQLAGCSPGIPLTKEEKIASRKRWDERYEKGQRRKHDSGTQG